MSTPFTDFVLLFSVETENICLRPVGLHALVERCLSATEKIELLVLWHAVS